MNSGGNSYHVQLQELETSNSKQRRWWYIKSKSQEWKKLICNVTETKIVIYKLYFLSLSMQTYIQEQVESSLIETQSLIFKPVMGMYSDSIFWSIFISHFWYISKVESICSSFNFILFFHCFLFFGFETVTIFFQIKKNCVAKHCKNQMQQNNHKTLQLKTPTYYKSVFYFYQM